MAKKTPHPPTREMLVALLQVIRTSTEPLLAKTLASQLANIQTVSEAQLTPILEQYATEGSLHKYSPSGRGKPRYWDRNYDQFVEVAVLRAVRENPGTISAKELANQIETPRLTEAQVAKILQSAVDQKIIFAYPGKTPSAKPRYSHHDPAVLGRQVAVEAARDASAPFTAKDIATWLKTAVVLSESNLTTILDELVATGDLFAIPAIGAKGKPRYWIHDAIEYGSRSAVQHVNNKGPQTLAGFKKELKGLSDVQIRQIIENLQANGQLILHPTGSGVKQPLYGTRPPAPSVYLKDIGIQLTKVVAMLKNAHVPMPDLRRAAVQLLEEAGISFGPDTGTPSVSASTGMTATEQAKVDLVALMKQIEPAAERGALVGARDLRRAANLQKLEFDQAVLALARQSRLSLHHHDYASSLSQVERDELVTDGNGKFYVGMALRSD